MIFKAMVTLENVRKVCQIVLENGQVKLRGKADVAEILAQKRFSFAIRGRGWRFFLASVRHQRVVGKRMDTSAFCSWCCNFR